MSDNTEVESQYVSIELRVIKRENMPAPEGVQGLLERWHLYDRAQESVWIIAFDGVGGLRRVGEVARGSYHDVSVPLPPLLLMVLLSGADRFWLVHNHPSGHIVPTLPDINLTHTVLTAANACGLRMEDHIIIASPNKVFSFAGNGMIGEPTESNAQAANESLLLKPISVYHSEDQ